MRASACAHGDTHALHHALTLAKISAHERINVTHVVRLK
jgi:hypothetical protein